MFSINHFNINVFDLEKSVEFYKEALELSVIREHVPEDKSFKLVYLSDEDQRVSIELTWLRDRDTPYNLGDNEFHIAFHADDFESAHSKHKEMGCICYENTDMGIYFIADPDGYWLEIIPKK